jgi:hypothetical protein
MHAEKLTSRRDWLEPALDPVFGLFEEPHAAIATAQPIAITQAMRVTGNAR